MLSVVILAICLCVPLVSYRVLSGGGEWNGLRDFMFNVSVSLIETLVAAALLMVCIIVPASGASMTEPKVESTYVSDDISMTNKKKTVKMEVDGEAMSFSRGDITIKTSSEDADIQSALDEGKSVLEVYVMTSKATLVEKRTCVLYTAPSTSEAAASVLQVDSEGDEQAEGE